MKRKLTAFACAILLAASFCVTSAATDGCIDGGIDYWITDNLETSF